MHGLDLLRGWTSEGTIGGVSAENIDRIVSALKERVRGLDAEVSDVALDAFGRVLEKDLRAVISSEPRVSPHQLAASYRQEWMGTIFPKITAVYRDGKGAKDKPSLLVRHHQSGLEISVAVSELTDPPKSGPAYKADISFEETEPDRLNI